MSMKEKWSRADTTAAKSNLMNY